MKNKIVALILLFLSCCAGTYAQKNKNPKTPAEREFTFHNLNDEAIPLFAFTYISPWNDPYGSDMPEFVLYEDGTLIFKKCREKGNPYSCRYRMSKLSAGEISRTMEKLRPQEFYNFDKHYSPNTDKYAVSDLTFRRFVMRKPDGTYKKVSTYGALSGDKAGYVAENVPPLLEEIVEFINSYDNDKTINFSFEYAELVIQPYKDFEDLKKIIKWSKKMPDLNDSKTIKHKEFGAYSLFTDKSFERKVSEIYYNLQDYRRKNIKAAVLINNRKWKMEMRLPFPSEKIWLENFRE